MVVYCIHLCLIAVDFNIFSFTQCKKTIFFLHTHAPLQDIIIFSPNGIQFKPHTIYLQHAEALANQTNIYIYNSLHYNIKLIAK